MSRILNGRIAGKAFHIPAHAGNVSSALRKPSRCTVYPACTRGTWDRDRRPDYVRWHIPACAGKRGRPDAVAEVDDGSSPHARGTLHPFNDVGNLSRFIPACAGNARSARRGSGRRTVHPRMRGERPPTIAATGRETGSSPHARGTCPLLPVRQGLERFIPACAGNATPPRTHHAPTTVHPRMRWERFPTSPSSRRAHGSSPHARGTHRAGDCRPARLRFIPACAGNARDLIAARDRRQVHPRMRGERSHATGGRVVRSGSSPHARGTLSWFQVVVLQ